MNIEQHNKSFGMRMLSEDRAGIRLNCCNTKSFQHCNKGIIENTEKHSSTSVKQLGIQSYFCQEFKHQINNILNNY